VSSFEYLRPASVAEAIAAVEGDPGASFLAGGTTQLDLLLKDRVITASTLVDVAGLPLHGISVNGDTLMVGALTTMEELAADPTVMSRLPVVREALLAGASTQLRNMATIGGNLLQRTRCRYFRDPGVPACNKRTPGSGCAAVTGPARMHAILGAGPDCIALHGSDLCVALAMLDATVHTATADGGRTISLAELYLTPAGHPDQENVLRHGELITRVGIPLLPAGTPSAYVKVRDRSSYEFALVSAAAALTVDHGVVTSARLALGGVGTVPWRAHQAEDLLVGAPANRDAFGAAARSALADAFTVPGTEFKVELAKRAIVRILTTLTGERS
jgi:xanthine dehydrogenase YagS FAD-binding subunit